MPTTRNNKESKKIGEYVLDKLLVEQAVSAIYLAHHEKEEDKPVFLVTLQPDAAKTSDLANRFQRRAKTLAQLEDEALLPLLDHGESRKRPYATMAYVPGQFLSERLEAETTASSSPNDKTKDVESLKLVKQLAAVLLATHPTGLFHHDLRPENIYLDEAGHPFLLDLAIPPTPSAISQNSEEPPAELDYQSPEQLSGKALSGRSNIFSLGVLLYRLLAGQKPALPVSEWDIFEYKGIAREEPLDKVRPNLTQATYDVVQESIWQKEWSRFETVAAQIEAIDRAIEAESAPPPPPPPVWLQFLNRLRQPKALKYVVPAIIFLFLLILIFMMMRGRANRQNNMTPTPDAAILPIEDNTAVLGEPNHNTTESGAELPTMTVEAQPNDAAASESEEIVPTEEVEQPTARPSPTETAVLPTPTETEIPPTNAPTATPEDTNTPTPEPTEVACTPSPPFGWIRYTIQEGDSLSALAQATNTTVERLQEVNCLETILLNVGQNIWLPFSPSPAPAATPTAVPTGDNPPPPPPEPNPPPTPLPPTPTAPAPPTPSP